MIYLLCTFDTYRSGQMLSSLDRSRSWRSPAAAPFCGKILSISARSSGVRTISAPQRGFAGDGHILRPAIHQATLRPWLASEIAEFGGQHDSIPLALERLGQQLLVVAVVVVRSIDEVDAQIYRAAEDGEGGRVRLARRGGKKLSSVSPAGVPIVALTRLLASAEVADLTGR